MDKIANLFIRKNSKKVLSDPSREEIKIVQYIFHESIVDALCELGRSKRGYLCIAITNNDFSIIASEYFMLHMSLVLKNSFMCLLEI